MDGAGASVPSGSLTILPEQAEEHRRGRKGRDAAPGAPMAAPVMPPPEVAPPAPAPRPPAAAAPAQAPQQAPVVQQPPDRPNKPVVNPAAPPPRPAAAAAPVAAPQAPGPMPVRQAPAPAPAAAQPQPPAPVAAPQQAPPQQQAPPPQPQAQPAGLQALKEAFAIDVAEREDRHRAEMHAAHQSYSLDVNAREDRHRTELHQAQQAYAADVAKRDERSSSQARAMQQTIDELGTKLNDALAARDHQSQARATAEGDLTTHRNAFESLRTELDTSRTEVAQLTARVRDLETALNMSQHEVERWTEKANRLEDEIRTALSAADRAAAQAARELDETTRRLETADERNARLLEQSAAHEAAGQQLRHTISEQRADRERISNERDTARQRCADLETELRATKYDSGHVPDDVSRQIEAAQTRATYMTDESTDDAGADELSDPFGQQRAALERMEAERDAARRKAAALEAELEQLVVEPRTEDADETPRSLVATEPLPYPSEGATAEPTPTHVAAEPTTEASDDHPLSLAAEIDLYPWQREALTAWADAGYRGVVEAVTDDGLTRLAQWAIGQAIDEGMKVVVLVPSSERVEQWYAGLRDALPINRVAKHTGGKDARLGSYDVVVAAAHNATKDSVFDVPFRGLVVAVDAHQYGTAALAPALNVAYLRRLGITVAYERDDDGIATHLDPYFSGVSFRLDYHRALTEGAIAPFDIALVSVQLRDSEQSEYDALDRQVKNLRTELIDEFGVPAKPTRAFLGQVTKLAGGRVGPARTIARNYQKAVAKRSELLAATTARDSVLRSFASHIRDDVAALIFTPTPESASHAARVIEGQRCATSSVLSSLEHEVRARRTDKPGEDENEVGLLVTGRAVGDDGPLPNADLGMIVGASRSKRQMIQRLGRITRLDDGQHGRLVVVYIEGSVEDDLASDEAPFITTALSAAASVKRFTTTDTDALFDFLANPQPVRV